jgi:hypothetical protein
MDVVKATTDFYRDVLRLWVEPIPGPFSADVQGFDIVIWRLLDQDDEPTGEPVGVEIDGFSGFDEWDGLPELPLLWQYRDWEPLPLVELLKRLQQELRARAEATTGSASRAVS